VSAFLATLVFFVSFGIFALGGSYFGIAVSGYLCRNYEDAAQVFVPIGMFFGAVIGVAAWISVIPPVMQLPILAWK